MFKNCRSNKLGVYQPGTEVPVPHKVRLSNRQFVNYGRDYRGRVVHFCRREWSSGAYDAVLGDFTAAPRPREDVGRFFQIPKRMRVLDIALQLQCHPNRLVSTMRTMYPDGALFQDVTSVCTLPQNTLVPLPAGLDLDAAVFSQPTTGRYVESRLWDATKLEYSSLPDLQSDGGPVDTEAILPDGSRIHKATLIKYLNNNRHLFGEHEHGKLNVGRLLRIIQGARNSTNNRSIAPVGDTIVGDSPLSVGIGSYLEYVDGSIRRVGLVVEIFKRHQNEGRQRRTRYYYPILANEAAWATGIEFCCHLCEQQLGPRPSRAGTQRSAASGSRRSHAGASKSKVAAAAGSRRSARSASTSNATATMDPGSSAKYSISMKRVVVLAVHVKALLAMEPVDGQATSTVSSRAAV